MTQLTQLIYFSKAVQPMEDEELAQLLNQCRQLNNAAGIPGMLLYIETSLYGNLEGRFIQALEGSAEKITNTFARIEIDERHQNITILHQREITKRDFAGWSMGYECKTITESTGKKMHHITDQLFEAQHSVLNIPMSYLKSFYALKHR